MSEVSRHFDSMGEFLAFLTGPEAKATAKKSETANRGRREFSGNVTFAEALDLAHTGWHEGVTAVSLAADRIRANMTQENPAAVCFDVTGQMFDVGAYLEGVPECWIAPDPERARKIYKIVVNIGMLSDVDPEYIINRGGAIVALIDALQSDPANIVSLELISCAKGAFTPEIRTVTQRINLGTAPLDLDAAAFAMAHPAMLRSLIFRGREILTERANLDPCGYGSSSPDPDHDQLDHSVIYFRHGTDNKDMIAWQTRESAAREIANIVDSLANRTA